MLEELPRHPGRPTLPSATRVDLTARNFFEYAHQRKRSSFIHSHTPCGMNWRGALRRALSTLVRKKRLWKQRAPPKGLWKKRAPPKRPSIQHRLQSSTVPSIGGSLSRTRPTTERATHEALHACARPFEHPRTSCRTHRRPERHGLHSGRSCQGRLQPHGGVAHTQVGWRWWARRAGARTSGWLGCRGCRSGEREGDEQVLRRLDGQQTQKRRRCECVAVCPFNCQSAGAHNAGARHCPTAPCHRHMLCSAHGSPLTIR